MPSSYKTPVSVAPRPARRPASASSRRLRVSIGSARPPLAWISRWSRFLTDLRSGTTWNQTRGPRPSGSTMQSAPIPRSSSGTPTSCQYSSQVAKPAGGGSSTYPRAAAQKRASRSGSVQSITSWKSAAIILSRGPAPYVSGSIARGVAGAQHPPSAAWLRWRGSAPWLSVIGRWPGRPGGDSLSAGGEAPAGNPDGGDADQEDGIGCFGRMVVDRFGGPPDLYCPGPERGKDVVDDKRGVGVGRHVAEFAAGDELGGVSPADVDRVEVGVVGPADRYHVGEAGLVHGCQPAEVPAFGQVVQLSLGEDTHGSEPPS